MKTNKTGPGAYNYLVKILIVALIGGSLSCGNPTKTQVMVSTAHPAEKPAKEKPRLLILTDIGGDPDDKQSLIRLCLYANEFDIEGIIASASGTPGELKEKTIKPELIREIIDAYGKVRPNLLLHHPDYPSASDLINKIKRGNPNRGEEFIGPGHDTEASAWIIKVVDQEDTRPVNISIWGGQTDLAQALWKVKNTRDSEAYENFISRIRIYDIGDQDNIFGYISDQFPGLFYILNNAREGEDRRNAAFRGMYLGGDESLTSLEWVNSHIREGHGALGPLYPTKTWTAPNPHGVLKEGDTPSWFYFLPNGLGDPDHPDWGSWGGRFFNNQKHYKDAEDQVGDIINRRATVWRWRNQYQNDFQARMDWCVKTFEEANHNPTAVINGVSGKEVVYLRVSSGEEVKLSARDSADPDGDELSYYWMIYPEPGTYKDKISINNPNAESAGFIAPDVQGNATLHVVLTVKDNGEPNLFSYHRAIVTVNND